MKKNILRVISLVLAASMIFAFASCTQEIQVRFVDQDGNDIDLESLFAGGNAATPSNSNDVTPSNETPSNSETPSETPSADPATPSETPSETPGASETSAENPTSAPTSGIPSTTAEILEFYKKAANNIAQNGAAGFEKKEWQAISNLNLSGVSAIDKLIASLAGNYMTTEADAEVQKSAKGSKESKDRFPGVTLSDTSKIASATCTKNASGNYNIKIVMKDEDTPKKSGSFLKEITNSLLLWEDIENELKNISQIKSYDGIHVIYKAFLIEAEITPDGKFVSMNHTAGVDIQIGQVKILFLNLENKSAHLDNFCQYRNFSY